MHDDFKITLKSARVNAGLTLKQASFLLEVNQYYLRDREKRPSKCPIGLLKKMEELYKIPINRFNVSE